MSSYNLRRVNRYLTAGAISGGPVKYKLEYFCHDRCLIITDPLGNNWDISARLPSDPSRWLKTISHRFYMISDTRIMPLIDTETLEELVAMRNW